MRHQNFFFLSSSHYAFHFIPSRSNIGIFRATLHTIRPTCRSASSGPLARPRGSRMHQAKRSSRKQSVRILKPHLHRRPSINVICFAEHTCSAPTPTGTARSPRWRRSGASTATAITRLAPGRGCYACPPSFLPSLALPQAACYLPCTSAPVLKLMNEVIAFTSTHRPCSHSRHCRHRRCPRLHRPGGRRHRRRLRRRLRHYYLRSHHRHRLRLPRRNRRHLRSHRRHRCHLRRRRRRRCRRRRASRRRSRRHPFRHCRSA